VVLNQYSIYPITSVESHNRCNIYPTPNFEFFIETQFNIKNKKTIILIDQNAKSQSRSKIYFLLSNFIYGVPNTYKQKHSSKKVLY